MSDTDEFRREYLGSWDCSPNPSPGPWHWRETMQRNPFAPSGRERVFVVLDANGKCVAECERIDDAEFIARNGPRASRAPGRGRQAPGATMSAHSPGPWSWGYDELFDANGAVILQNNTEYLPHQVTPADEALIAVAPEMLELLREWRDGLRFVDGVEQPQIAIGPETKRAAMRQRLAVTKDFGDRVERLLARIDGAAKER